MSRQLSTLLLLHAALSGCAYTGTAVDIRPAALKAEPGWLLLEDVPIVLQRGDSDCGAAALAMVLQYLGEPATLDQIISETGHTAGESLRAGDLRDLARRRGLQSFLYSGDQRDLVKHLGKGRPIIVGLVKQTLGDPISHYEVVIGYHPQREVVVTLDPARGWRVNAWPGFLDEWTRASQLALVIVPRRPPSPPIRADVARLSMAPGLVSD